MLQFINRITLKQTSFKKTVAFVWAFLILFAIPTFAVTPSVAVIYPELRAPYNKIFTDIADGIEIQVNGSTKRYLLKKDYSIEDLSQWLRENDINVCVALGVRGESAAMKAGLDIPIVLGGVLTPKTTNPSQSGISLAPSPEKLFTLLKRFKRNIERVIVVYNPEKTEWIIRQAQIAAVNQNIHLDTYTTSSLSKSAKIYKKIFKNGNLDNTAIWLPQDRTSIDNRTLLSSILEQAWTHEVPVFSSSLAHVNKGVLFAMYPDNLKMGKSLGRFALNKIDNTAENTKQIIPVEDLQTAFNKRTAEHLGVNVSSDQLRRFDAVFPSK